MKKLSFKQLVIACFASILLGTTALKAEELKVGFVYVGPIGDHGWTYRHHVGLQAIEKHFGDRVSTSFVESVPEGADAERVIRQLASSGHNLIFTTSFGYMNPTIKVAKQFPNVKFEHATGYKRAKNVSTYVARFYEGRYEAGILAGHMTKTNSIGYIASFPIPEVVRGVNSFTLGLRSVNPNATVKVVWVNTWYDPGKEADAAKALIDQGADVILQHTDSPAPLQVAEKRGVWAVGQASDNGHFAPKATLTSIIDNWDNYYVARTEAVLNGTWKSHAVWDGLKEGMVEMADYNKAIPADVAKQAKAARAAIMDGSFHPFTGPIKDQSGAVKIASGSVMSDADLEVMDWFIEGVQGSVPK